jgi:amidase
MNPISRRGILGAAGGIAVSSCIPSVAYTQPGVASGELAFSSATDLAQLIQRKQISSFELTQPAFRGSES